MMGWIDWTLAIATIIVGLILTVVVMLQSSKDQQSAIRERRIRWAFMWAGTNMAPMLSWIWTDEPTTKPMPAP